MVSKKNIKILIIILLLLFTYKFSLNYTKVTNKTSKSELQTKPNNLIEVAKSFLGTKYKYGGTTKNGMDCSGLVYTSFNKIGVELPRSSFNQSKKGRRIELEKVKKGDLLFFKTDGSNKINHVGLVINLKDSTVQFIHSSTSKGIIISSLNETYWKDCFVITKRIL